MRFVPCTITAVVALATAPLHAQSFEYLLDDGAGNYNIGPSSFDANMTWANYYEAVEGGNIITKVSVAFGDIENNDGVPGPDGVLVAILNDPTNDGDPSDAVLLAMGEGTWVDTEPNGFLDFSVPPTAVDGGFFVAVAMDVLERANPARMDPQGIGAGTQSWMFYNPEPRFENLGASKYILHMSDSPFIGAWMVRATGRSCMADITADGVLDIFDVFAFLDLYAAADAGASFVNDDALDIFDVFAFLDSYEAGCVQ